MESMLGSGRSPSDCGEDRKPMILGDGVSGILQVSIVLNDPDVYVDLSVQKLISY